MASFDYNYRNDLFIYLFFFCCCCCFFFHANESYCFLLSTGITKFEFEEENEIDSDGCSQMTLS